MTTPLDLEELKRLLAKATPGPFYRSTDGGIRNDGGFYFPMTDEDALYVERLLQDAPQMIAELEQLRAEVEALRKVADPANFLMSTMKASEGPDANGWVEGVWSTEPRYHLKCAIDAIAQEKKP